MPGTTRTGLGTEKLMGLIDHTLPEAFADEKRVMVSTLMAILQLFIEYSTFC